VMSAQSDKICRQLEQALAGVQTEFGSRLLTKLRDRTPVRTGRTRSLWTKVEIGSATEITNGDRETIMRLNDGWSQQAPAGFIEQVIDETTAEMRREVERPVKL
jgi:hypothetical protein